MSHRLRRCWLLSLLAPALGIILAITGCRDAARSEGAEPGTYLFCFWNVENLFDDQDNHRERADKEYDAWFAHDPAALQLKLKRLSEAMLKLNGGRGPDIVALAEVENEHAAELLQAELNRGLGDESLHYKHLLRKVLPAGRHTATAIWTGLRARGNKPRLHGRQLRILEGHIEVNGHDLFVPPPHWTSRRTDDQGPHRAKYADQI